MLLLRQGLDKRCTVIRAQALRAEYLANNKGDVQ